MKCDELKAEQWLDYSGEPMPCYPKAKVDETIAELKAENERLKKCEIWMKQHFYCEEVIACESAKNRKLKRALYKACANWAMAESYSVLNDVPTANRWVSTLRKLKAKLEAYK